MRKMYKVLDHGHVKYLDHMGDDATIAMDARTSYNKRQPGEDRSLLRRLMRDRHTSPFEMAEVKVMIKCPIFVARQIVRHRTANMNEVSARYTKLPNEMYEPATVEFQSKDNKQGRGETIAARAQKFMKDLIAYGNRSAYATYDALINNDVSREIARGTLPLNVYTEFVWKMDLHNLLHFLQLRLDPHAQYECRVYAEALWEMVQDLFPMCAEAFDDYRLNSYTCSRFEVDLLTYLLSHNGAFVGRMIEEQHKSYVDGGAMTQGEWDQFMGKFGL